MKFQKLVVLRMFHPNKGAWRACLPRVSTANFAAGGEQGGLGPEPGTVNIVADQRVADRRQMNPDLVGPAGFEMAFRSCWRSGPLASRYFSSTRQWVIASRPPARIAIFSRA